MSTTVLPPDAAIEYDIDAAQLRSDIQALTARGVHLQVRPVRAGALVHGVVSGRALYAANEVRVQYARTQHKWVAERDGNPLSFHRGPKCDALAAVVAALKAALM